VERENFQERRTFTFVSKKKPLKEKRKTFFFENDHFQPIILFSCEISWNVTYYTIDFNKTPFRPKIGAGIDFTKLLFGQKKFSD
jgi:hypothetical protein